MSNGDHWESVYQSKGDGETSWYTPHLETSLQLIRETGAPLDGPIIDVGGGSSNLVDDLLANGYADVTVVDLASAALDKSQTRLGPAASQVRWLAGDITRVELPPHHYRVWHDRAVFHFLTDPAARDLYIAQARAALQPGGHIIVATFGPNGPEQCSGLDVARYSGDELHQTFGKHFERLRCTETVHQTPWGSEQEFTYCLCRRI